MGISIPLARINITPKNDIWYYIIILNKWQEKRIATRLAALRNDKIYFTIQTFVIASNGSREAIRKYLFIKINKSV